MQYKISKTKPLLILLPLLILHLGLLSLQVTDKEDRSLFRRGILQLVSPFLIAADQVGRLFEDTWDEYFNLVEVRSTNEKLQREVVALQLEVQKNIEVLNGSKHLRTLLETRNQLPARTSVANVIGRSPSFISYSVLLDRGSSDGVEMDNPVMTPDGIVGRIINVFTHSSEMQVLLDPDAAAGALISRTRTQGVIRGNGGPLLGLHYIINQEDVEIGDLIVTSGQDSIYPKGYPLGQVVRSIRGESGLKKIDVLPLAKFNRLEEVLLLLEVALNP